MKYQPALNQSSLNPTPQGEVQPQHKTLLQLLRRWLTSRPNVQKSYIVAADERRRIARELHDTIAQDFTAILMQLRSIPVEHGGYSGADEVRRALRAAEQGLENTRTCVRALRTTGNAGSAGSKLVFLAESLNQRLSSLVDGSRLSLSVHCCTALVVSEHVRREIIMIASEAVQNAIKHAKAETVRCVVALERDLLRMEIQDDGVGFDNHRYRAGFGMLGMQERASLVDAKLDITSTGTAGTAGTVVRLSMPRRYVCNQEGSDHEFA